ncbi:unnamed protein product [Polarella glacialis]|uniref:HORMA domain-containing protein n=1 Tax=Polarella glacialis TaxID=89957 RepID=A0A813G9S0_POLGL|nr:unnamed protein product [Polarella glacialis]
MLDINNLLVLFLEAAIFTILKVRGLYHPHSFKRQNVLGHCTWWSSCPSVESYVLSLCESLRPAISRDRLHNLVLNIHNAKGCLKERFVISFPLDPQVLAQRGADDLTQALGLALTQLEMSSAVLCCSPGEGGGAETWSISVETKEPRAGGGGVREEALLPFWAVRSSGGLQPPLGRLLHPLGSLLGPEMRSEDVVRTLDSDRSVGTAAGGPRPVVIRFHVEEICGEQVVQEPLLVSLDSPGEDLVHSSFGSADAG